MSIKEIHHLERRIKASSGVIYILLLIFSIAIQNIWQVYQLEKNGWVNWSAITVSGILFILFFYHKQKITKAKDEMIYAESKMELLSKEIDDIIKEDELSGAHYRYVFISGLSPFGLSPDAKAADKQVKPEELFRELTKSLQQWNDERGTGHEKVAIENAIGELLKASNLGPLLTALNTIRPKDIFLISTNTENPQKFLTPEATKEVLRNCLSLKWSASNFTIELKKIGEFDAFKNLNDSHLYTQSLIERLLHEAREENQKIRFFVDITAAHKPIASGIMLGATYKDVVITYTGTKKEKREDQSEVETLQVKAFCYVVKPFEG
jgi:hypothetical protein